MDKNFFAFLATVYWIDWAAVASLAAVCTLFAILWQVRNTKKEAQTARTVHYWERFEFAWNELRDLISDHRRNENLDYFKSSDTRALAKRMFQLVEEIAISRKHRILDNKLLDDQFSQHASELAAEFIFWTEKLPTDREWYPHARQFLTEIGRLKSQ